MRSELEKELLKHTEKIIFYNNKLKNEVDKSIMKTSNIWFWQALLRNNYKTISNSVNKENSIKDKIEFHSLLKELIDKKIKELYFK